jgi:hypothetical protein
MVDDLRANHLPVGMTWVEVRRLLGPPYDEWRARSKAVRRWIVGHTLMDCATLTVQFEHGRVVGSGRGQT